MKIKKILLVTLCASFIGTGLGSSFIARVPVKAASEYADISEYESLKEIYKDKFSMGVAVQAIDHWNDQGAEIGNPAKEELIKQQFNSITFGNELKPAYNFDKNSETYFTVDRAADELLHWAKDNGIKVRGHVLVWHSQVNPDFFCKDFNALSGGVHTTDCNAELDKDCLVSADELRVRLKTYIYGAMEYMYSEGFADTIYSWDVVNEASDESQPDCMRRSYWYRILGPEFLYYSFLYAREAEDLYSVQYAEQYGLSKDGDLSSIRPWLFYNDYNDWFPARVDGIINFLTKMPFNEGQKIAQSDSIKEGGDGTIYGDGLIDGIGLQGHMSAALDVEECRRAIRKYSAAINNLQVTEMDVNQLQPGAKGVGTQAQFYYDYFKMLLEEKENGANITNVTFWGLTDTSSWRAEQEPLLFYQYLDRKPSYYGVVAAGKGEDFSADELPAGIIEVKDKEVTFEPYKEGNTNKGVVPSEVGFYSRGTGHQSSLKLTHKENHTEDAPVGFALQVSRGEADATLSMNASEYIGHKIDVSFYVKTEDKEFRTGIDGFEDGGVTTINSNVEWTLVSVTYTLPADLKGADIFFETDGNADIFIDDVTIKVDSKDEEDGTGAENKNSTPDNLLSGIKVTKEGIIVLFAIALSSIICAVIGWKAGKEYEEKSSKE